MALSPRWLWAVIAEKLTLRRQWDTGLSSAHTHWPFKKFSDSFWVVGKWKWPGVSIAAIEVPETEKSASYWMQRHTPDPSAQLEKLYNLRQKSFFLFFEIC